MRRVLISVSAAAAIAGCGSASHARAVSLMLDFSPNAVHAGIYAAMARGYDQQQGISLRVIPPPSPVDSVKLLEAGRVDFSILDIHDLAIARDRGANLVGVMAIVEHPLAALIAQPGVASPKALDGQTVGTPGDPSDAAVLDSIVSGAGGNPRTIRTIQIGGDAVADLLSGRVAAATGFWNDEGVTLQSKRPGFRVFRLDRYGAPPYPELVLCTRRGTSRDLIRRTVRTLVLGYRALLADPRTAAAELEARVPGLDPRLLAAQLHALLPAFSPIGRLNTATLRAWASWEARFGLVPKPPDVAQAFDTSF